MEEKSTVALCMIVKDEVDAVTKIIDQSLGIFDQFVFVVSDAEAYNKLLTVDFRGLDDHIEFIHRPWNNRFDEARNFAQEKIKTTYWFWIDCDDEFNFKAIPKLVEIMDSNNFDQILLPYNYAQDENGECVAFHWRERLLRTSHPFTWKGWVHETPISNLPYKAHRVNVPVVHRNDMDHTQESLKRNHEILMAATAESDDPRYQLYLGTSFYSLGKFGEAIETLDAFNKVSGNVEDIYRSLCCMSECAMKLKRPNAATQYALQAAAQIPEYPQAYRLLALWETEQGNWNEALEWCQVAETKPVPSGLGVFDPSAATQNKLVGVHCNMMLGQFNDALKWLREIDPEHPARKDLENSILNEADAETFITLLPKFRKYFADEKALYNALCYDMRFDARLRGLRDLVEEPKTWSDKSIVFLVGEGYEDWGPQTLDKGMGGSEEAVIYLSRELAKMGWEVTIYGAVSDQIIDEIKEDAGCLGPLPEHPYVEYLPWREINKNDNFNVFVAWRAPDFTEHIKANVKIADIHDVLNKPNMKDYADVTYFVKSNYHRGLYPELADEKFRVIGNGIKKEQFV